MDSLGSCPEVQRLSAFYHATFYYHAYVPCTQGCVALTGQVLDSGYNPFWVLEGSIQIDTLEATLDSSLDSTSQALAHSQTHSLEDLETVGAAQMTLDVHYNCFG